MDCPNCSRGMFEARYEDAALDFCPRCCGVWAEHDEFSRVVTTREVSFTDDEVVRAVHGTWKALPADRSLACPRCAAPLKQFDYVKLGLFLDRCPKEHGVFFDGGELSKVQILMERHHGPNPAGEPASGPLKCPREGVALDASSCEGQQLDECASCAGVWIASPALAEVIARRLKEMSAADKARAEKRHEAAQEELFMGRILCPVCRALLDRLVYAYDTGIVIDRCRHKHGLWLDGGELEKMQGFIEGCEELAPADRAAWGPLLQKALKDRRKRREEMIRRLGQSRFVLVNRFLNYVAGTSLG